MQIKEIIEKTVPSMRLIICSGKEELFRGFCATFQYSSLDEKLEVEEMGLHIETFRRDDEKKYVMEHTRHAHEKIEDDEIWKFKYSDLQVNIYMKVKVKV